MAGIPRSNRTAQPGQKEAPMIFRQFLAPKTGCASYLFG
jgi:hypothetical protein